MSRMTYKRFPPLKAHAGPSSLEPKGLYAPRNQFQLQRVLHHDTMERSTNARKEWESLVQGELHRASRRCGGRFVAAVPGLGIRHQRGRFCQRASSRSVIDRRSRSRHASVISHSAEYLWAPGAESSARWPETADAGASARAAHAVHTRPWKWRRCYVFLPTIIGATDKRHRLRCWFTSP